MQLLASQYNNSIAIRGNLGVRAWLTLVFYRRRIRAGSHRCRRALAAFDKTV